MTFPHPKPRKEQHRKKDIPNTVCVVVSIQRRIINVAEYRNATDDVNPAKNRTFGCFRHDESVLLLSVNRVVHSGPDLAGQWSVSIPNCLAYSACSRCQSNFMASGPAMRP